MLACAFSYSATGPAVDVSSLRACLIKVTFKIASDAIEGIFRNPLGTGKGAGSSPTAGESFEDLFL